MVCQMSVSVLWNSQRKTSTEGVDAAPAPLDELRRARRDGSECDVATLPPRRGTAAVVTCLPPELELTRRRDARPAATPPTEGAVLLLPDGTRSALRRATVVGRAPRPQHDAAPLVLADPTRSVSRDHALLEPVARGLSVTDLGSGNGTTVTTPDGSVVPLVPGRAQEAPPGSAIALGDLLVTVEDPADGGRAW